MLSKGPNVLNLRSYAQSAQQQLSYTEQPSSEVREVDTNAIQQKFDTFVKDIQRYDQILSKVAQNIEEGEDDAFITDFYPEFITDCVYIDDEQKKIVANTDPELARVINNLENNNRSLKEEIRGWVFQFSKKSKLTEALITENNLLRKYISEKNKQIVSLIQKINQTENQDLNFLNQTLQELKQQNGVLTSHLQNLRVNLKEKKEEQKELSANLHKAYKKKIDIEKTVVENEDEEEHFGKMMVLLESSLEDGNRRVKKLQVEKQRLLKIKEEFELDEEQIQRELKICNIDKEDIEQNLKRKFNEHQSQKEKIMDEIENYTEKIQKCQDKIKLCEVEINRNEDKIKDYGSLCKDLDTKIKENTESVLKNQKELEAAKQREAQYLCDIDTIKFDLEVLNEEYEQLKKIEQEKEEQQKRELIEMQQMQKREFQRWQNEQNKVERQCSMKILHKKSQLASQQKKVQQWEHKLVEKKEQIAYLKAQMKQIKENQVKMTELRGKLKNMEKN